MMLKYILILSVSSYCSALNEPLMMGSEHDYRDNDGDHDRDHLHSYGRKLSDRNGYSSDNGEEYDYQSGYIRSFVPVCNGLVEAFAEVSANFTKCTMMNAKPCAYCSNCYRQYKYVREVYYQLENMTDEEIVNNQSELRRCNDWILNADKIMAIQTMFSFFKSLWRDASCSNCFFNSSNLADHFIEFERQLRSTESCFKNFTTVLSPNSVVINTTVCSYCEGDYQKLSAYYKTLDNKYGSDLCMDIIDAMNSTRLLWSDQFSCSAAVDRGWVTFLVTALFFLLPIVFYISTNIHYQRIERKIVKQNRLQPLHRQTANGLLASAGTPEQHAKS